MAGENAHGSGREREEGAAAPPPPPELGGLPVEGGPAYTFVSVAFGRPLSGNISSDDLQSMTRQFAVKGVLFAAVGVVAILFPFLFGLAVEQLLAWLLVLGGGITLVQFLLVCGSPGTASFLLLGALHFAVGLWLLLRPIEGLQALTLVLTGWFLVHGFLKLFLAFQVRDLSSWPVVMVSGLISIALGVFIAWLTPTYGLVLLGIVFGADLLSTGISCLLISLVACLGRGQSSDTDAEQAREPLLPPHGSGRAVAAASA
ncbi:unnamed protein product [Calypogeia fissa]